MTTSPGFSSRSSVHLIRQFPQRDEAVQMSEQSLEAGWSNSAPAENAPEDVRPDVQTPDEVKPGFSNAKAVKATASEPEPEPDADASDSGDADEGKPVKKAAAKKSAAKKKG